MSAWEGVVASLITPLKDRGDAIDAEAMRKYCDFIIEKGVHGIFALGTTGEGPLLSLSERRTVAETVVAHVNKRIPVIIHTGSITTKQTIELTGHCRDIGADAAGMVLPYYYRLDDQSIFTHFQRIADAVPDFPFFIYNIPQSTVNNLSPALFEKLINTIGTIAGVKTSNPDIFQIMDYISIAKERCTVFVGCDHLILPALFAGARGIVSGNCSALPEPFLDLYLAFKKQEFERAREHQAFCHKVENILVQGPSIALFKRTLEFRGVKAGNVREPNRELTLGETDNLRKSLKELELV